MSSARGSGRSRARGLPCKPALSFLLPAAASLLAACSESGASSGGADGWRLERSTVDGVEVVRTVGNGEAAVTLHEDLRLGSLEGAEHETFGAVVAVVPLADGSRFAALDRQTLRIHVYDDGGRHLHSFGGRGEGPGEFEDMGGAARLPDGALAIHDGRLGRLTIFSADGAFIESRAVGGGFFSTTNLLYPSDDGVLLRINLRAPGSAPGAFQAALVRFRDGLMRIDTLLAPDLPVDPAFTQIATQGGRTSIGSVPFSPQLAWSWHPSGHWIAGTGASYHIAFIDDRGTTVRAVEREVEAAPVLSDEAAEQRARTEAAMTSVQADWRWTGPGVPERKPFFRSLTVGTDGTVWVRRYVEAVRREGEPPGPGQTGPLPPLSWLEAAVYDLFDAEGRFLGELRPPPRFSLLTATADRVWSREADALGVPQLVRYRVELPSLWD